MAESDRERKRHIDVSGYATTEPYQSPQQFGGGRPAVPARDRSQHGPALQAQIADVKGQAEQARNAQVAAGLEEGLGLQVEFESFPDIEFAFESLARERSGIELLNVRHEANTTFATVFVPDGRLEHFEKLVREYVEHRTDRSGKSRDHQRLVDAIQQIRAASLKALWTDRDEVFPESEDETLWWEVWLPVRRDRQRVADRFRELADGLGIRVATGSISFPERTVMLAHASKARMQRSMMTLNNIAELRRAKETAEFFDSLSPEEQVEWVDELLGRTQFSSADSETSYVCLLDTGVNRGHPLIQSALEGSDLHTVEPAWGVDDGHGHGTGMAGLALFGDVTGALDDVGLVRVPHRLESVKLLPRDGSNSDDPRHHGYLTVQGVANPEITAPTRTRVFAMMLTARDNRDRGRPSAWSSTLDRLACDADNQGENPRLFVVAGGNVDDPNAWGQYPESNATDGIHDPAQAWNALTVGAYTVRTHISDSSAEDCEPIAPHGGLSPFSTTSMTWPQHYPMKPDVVFEGGNAARDALSPVRVQSLLLLTANHEPERRLLTTANATSAATALAGRMAAQLQGAYPELWPEAIRGLIVHSAEWTESMRRMFLSGERASKEEYHRLVRHCGFGVPNPESALWSASDSLTLVAQGSLQPFQEGSSTPVLRELALHHLPWPVDELAALGETEVEMRVTLSYFVEPNPSARGVSSRYRYESHGLRFDVKRPYESESQFRARINQAVRDEVQDVPSGGSDPQWLLGKRHRHRGSLHSDIWRGSAADLAARAMLAVYPAIGWWKTRPPLQRYEDRVRYVLLVSIRAPEQDVDLYVPIASQLKSVTLIET